MVSLSPLKSAAQTLTTVKIPLMSDKHLIVGLGNPGREYEKTRHNVGFWVVDALVTRHQLGTGSKERKSIVYTGQIKGKPVVLAKPQTYMNLSGEAVRALLDFYKIPLERLIVVHDDLDTPLGTLKVRRQGGHGGQNGVRNILLHVGSEHFARVRFGIGRPPGRMQPKDYVLQPFVGNDQITAQQMVERAADAVESWLTDGIEITMTRFNGGLEEAAPRLSLEEELALTLRAVELAPHDPEPLEALARLYRRAKEDDKAVDAHLRLAELHRAQGNLRRMLHEWDNAVRLKPTLTDLQAQIARENAAQGDVKRATQAWLRLAETWQTLGELQRAVEAVQEALTLNPQHARALELLAELRSTT
jgi:PTH1 family peptidyl-tRNA hydrolase